MYTLLAHSHNSEEFMVVPVAAFLIGAALAALVIWLIAHARTRALQELLASAQKEAAENKFDVNRLNDLNAGFRERLAATETTLRLEKQAAAEKLALLHDAETQLREAFEALSAEALRNNSEAFLQLATAKLQSTQQLAKGELDEKRAAIEHLVAPIQESLTRVDSELHNLENARIEAYTRLLQQVTSLSETQEKLKSETGNLVKALRSPTVRGRWGEIQLHRVVEMAGMLPYCDFVEQPTATTADGRLRPDLIVKLPGGKNVVVDSKAPLQAYLDAYEEQDEDVRRSLLVAHARQIRDHMNKLSAKSYWDQFQPAPEFVVMFLPGETFFSAALQHDPALIEHGVGQRVIPASPTTLIALLRAVAYGWQQQKIAESAQEISDLGREVYDRLRVLAGHFDALGKGLHHAVDSYNKAIGSLETRVFVTARKFSELGTSTKEDLPELTSVEVTPRGLESDDWTSQQPLVLPEGTGE